MFNKHVFILNYTATNWSINCSFSLLSHGLIYLIFPKLLTSLWPSTICPKFMLVCTSSAASGHWTSQTTHSTNKQPSTSKGDICLYICLLTSACFSFGLLCECSCVCVLPPSAQRAAAANSLCRVTAGRCWLVGGVVCCGHRLVGGNVP